jgi:hypothetical protein
LSRISLRRSSLLECSEEVVEFAEQTVETTLYPAGEPVGRVEGLEQLCDIALIAGGQDVWDGAGVVVVVVGRCGF